MLETVSLDWVYEHLICEFNHWDICLLGLVDRDGEKMLCRCCDEYAEDVRYTLNPIDWTDECTEYLEDYRVAYKHWFHENGRRPYTYNNWPLAWFSEKWEGRDPLGKKSK